MMKPFVASIKFLALKRTMMIYIVMAFFITYHFLTDANSIYFDADNLYLPALFSDVFIHKHNFLSWSLTPAPYFFPDMLVFFLINAVFHNVLCAFIVYAFFQNALALFLISNIAYRVTKSQSIVMLVHIIFLLSMLMIFSMHTEVFYSRIRSAWHFGTMINGLLFLYLFVAYSDNYKRKILAAIFLLTIVSVSSDLLFVVQFLAPLILSLIILKLLGVKIFPSTWKISIILIFACVIGVFIKNSFNAPTLSDPYFLRPVLPLIVVIENLMLNFVSELRGCYYALGSVFLFYVLLIIKNILNINNYKKINYSKSEGLLLFLSMFVLISPIVSVANVLAHNTVVARYLLNFFWFPIFFFWLLSKEISNKNVILMLISAIIIISQDWENLPLTNAHYSKVINCVDNVVHQYNLSHKEKIQYGIANFWNTKEINLFTKEGVVLAQYKKNMERHMWAATSENYREAYDFAVVRNLSDNDLNPTFIEKINGKPEFVYECDKNVTLMIYGKSRLLTNEVS